MPLKDCFHLEFWCGGTHFRVQEMEAESDAYMRLLSECVLPHIRTHLLNQWEPRNPEPALALLEVNL